MSDLKETIVLHKLGAVALIGFSLNSGQGTVFTWDGRTENSVVQNFPTAKETWEKFFESLKISQKRGWMVAHRGEPNEG